MREYIRSLHILSEEELDQINLFISTKIIEKGGYLIQEGAVCREIVFIKEGVLRSFFVKENGEEITNCISFENDPMSAFSSYINETPTQENIQAIVDTKVEIISKKDIESLFNSNINWQKVGRKLAELQYTSLEQRIISFQKNSAMIRYLELSKQHPQYIKLIPLQYISSYLGISTRHLTRVRKSLL